MDVKDYMQRDFELLEKHVSDVAKAYQHQDPGVTMQRASEMFEAFSRRFSLEDFLLSKIEGRKSSTDVLKTFLSRRRKVRDRLEDMLMLHVSEPDFLNEIRGILNECELHVQFLRDNFYPEFVDKLTPDQEQYVATALEDRLHQISFK
jgi:hypothetical protein